MDEKCIELLKQQVAKWDEAVIATEGLVPRVAEADRSYLRERAAHYRATAQEVRKFLEKRSVA